MQNLPIVVFDGQCIIIETREQAAVAVRHIRESGAIVGFDTETRPSFAKGVTYKVALVQLAVNDVAYLFRLNKMDGMPDELCQLLQDANVVKVGLSTHDDFANLRKWNELFEPRGFIELQQLVRRYGIEDLSLTKIYAILFGQRISKRQRLSNWEADQLTPKQIEYAAFDAVACVDIYTALLSMGRSIINQY